MTKSRFSPPGYPIFGHVLEIERGVPLTRGLSGVFREIGTAGYGIRSVDGRQQGQIPARIGHRAAAKSHRVEVVVEPETVVHHPAEESRLVRSARAGETAHPAPILASRVNRDGEGRLGQSRAIQFVVVPLVLDAVVGVDSIRIAYRVRRSAGHGIGEIILSDAIVVEDPFDVLVRLPKDLAAETKILVE